jgi:hypothetical protein
MHSVARRLFPVCLSVCLSIGAFSLSVFVAPEKVSSICILEDFGRGVEWLCAAEYRCSDGGFEEGIISFHQSLFDNISSPTCSLFGIDFRCTSK